MTSAWVGLVLLGSGIGCPIEVRFPSSPILNCVTLATSSSNLRTPSWPLFTTSSVSPDTPVEIGATPFDGKGDPSTALSVPSEATLKTATVSDPVFTAYMSLRCSS